MGGEVAVTASLLRRAPASLLRHVARVWPAAANSVTAVALDGRTAARAHGAIFEHASTALVLGVVLLASFLQALGAAMRKHSGGSRDDYWNSPRWWTAFAVTMAGGLVALVVMPYVTVVVFVPVTTTVQVTSNFFFGVFYFGETVHHFQAVGLCCAVLGAVCVNLQKGAVALDPWELADFWASWSEPRFLQFNAGWWLFLVFTRFAFELPFHHAFCAGYLSTLTYICMRSLSSGFGDMSTSFASSEWWGAAVFGLLIFNLLTVHVQQLMLKGPLSLVEAIFGASQTLIGCTIAGVFFREESVYDNALFACSTLLTACGLLLLAIPTLLVDEYTPRLSQPCMQRDAHGWSVPLVAPEAGQSAFPGGTPKAAASPVKGFTRDAQSPRDAPARAGTPAPTSP